MEFGSVELLQEVINTTKDRQKKKLLTNDSKNDELLSSIDLDLKDLTPHANELLSEMASYKKASSLHDLNPMSLYSWHSDLELESMDYKLIILELEQKVKNIENRIKKDSDELEAFREDMTTVKETMKESQIEFHDKKKCSINNKISNYESKNNELIMRLSKCNIPVEVLPDNVKRLEKEVENVLNKRKELKNVVDNMTLVKSAKKDLFNLKFNQTQT